MVARQPFECRTVEYSVGTSFATNVQLLRMARGVRWLKRSCDIDRRSAGYAHDVSKI
jgi:hypothetical protein